MRKDEHERLSLLAYAWQKAARTVGDRGESLALNNCAKELIVRLADCLAEDVRRGEPDWEGATVGEPSRIECSASSDHVGDRCYSCVSAALSREQAGRLAEIAVMAKRVPA